MVTWEYADETVPVSYIPIDTFLPVNDKSLFILSIPIVLVVVPKSIAHSSDSTGLYKVSSSTLSFSEAATISSCVKRQIDIGAYRLAKTTFSSEMLSSSRVFCVLVLIMSSMTSNLADWYSSVFSFSAWRDSSVSCI